MVTLPAFTGCYRAKPKFDRQESRLRQLSSVTHGGKTGSHRISTLDTAHAGLTTVSPGGLTVENQIMPEEPR